MLKQIAIAGMLCATTTPVFAQDVEVEKITAHQEVTVYKDIEAKETTGKLFKDNIADVVAHYGDWTQISSGDVKGFVRTEEINTKEDAKKHIFEQEIKGVVKTETEAIPVKSETEDLVKPYIVKEAETIEEGEEFTVKNYGDNILIEKDNELYSVKPKDIDVDYKLSNGKTDAVIVAEKKEKEDTEAANAVMVMFDELAEDIELADKPSIEEARNAYNNLTDDQKKKVTTLNELEEAESELAEEEKKEQERIKEEEKKAEALKIAEEQAASLASSEDREANAIKNADYYNEIAQAQVSYGVDTTGWETGIASAYGGYSDASIPSNARTATGDPVTETTMGVAVPMAWSGFRSLYGRKVLISYGGKTVTATINDCGNMGGGSRSLDLQPGVFRAFGFTNCYDWGLKTVSYKIL